MCVSSSTAEEKRRLRALKVKVVDFYLIYGHIEGSWGWEIFFFIFYMGWKMKRKYCKLQRRHDKKKCRSKIHCQFRLLKWREAKGTLRPGSRQHGGGQKAAGRPLLCLAAARCSSGGAWRQAGAGGPRLMLWPLKVRGEQYFLGVMGWARRCRRPHPRAATITTTPNLKSWEANGDPLSTPSWSWYFVKIFYLLWSFLKLFWKFLKTIISFLKNGLCEFLWNFCAWKSLDDRRIAILIVTGICSYSVMVKDRPV